MKKTLIILNILFLSVAAQAQEDLTLYNMDVINQSNQINPSLMPENGGYIGIPILSSTDIRFTNSGFTWRDLHYTRPDDSVTIDIDNAVNKLPEKNYISFAARATIMSGGFKIRNNYFSLNITERAMFNFTFPKELFQLLLQGNGAFIGQEIDLRSMAFDATHYREYGIGWTRALNKKLTIGGRLKYLYGMENFSSAKSNLSFYTAPDDYRLELTSGYTINTSTTGNDSTGNGGNYMFGLKNTGFAVDLGFTYFYSDRWKFNASIIDLGSISWKSNVKNLVTANGSYSFDGIDINQFLSDSASSTENLTDSLSDSFKPTNNSDAYTTKLPTEIYLNSGYKLDQKMFVSGLIHATVFRNTVQPSVTFALNRRLTNHFSASISYSMINHHANNVGAGLAVNVGAFQFFLLSDNWIGTINPLSNNTLNAHFGFNLIFGRQKVKKAPDYGVQNKSTKTDTKGSIMSEPIETEESIKAGEKKN
jgi:hypothetical protein